MVVILAGVGQIDVVGVRPWVVSIVVIVWKKPCVVLAGLASFLGLRVGELGAALEKAVLLLTRSVAVEVLHVVICVVV